MVIDFNNQSGTQFFLASLLLASTLSFPLLCTIPQHQQQPATAFVPPLPPLYLHTHTQSRHYLLTSLLFTPTHSFTLSHSKQQQLHCSHDPFTPTSTTRQKTPRESLLLLLSLRSFPFATRKPQKQRNKIGGERVVQERTKKTSERASLSFHPPLNKGKSGSSFSLSSLSTSLSLSFYSSSFPSPPYPTTNPLAQPNPTTRTQA